jgi:hypothetical protein
MPRKKDEKGLVLDVKALDIALIHAGKPGYAIGAAVGISPTTLSNMRRGDYSVEKSHEICTALEELLNVPPGGLRFGKFHE